MYLLFPKLFSSERSDWTKQQQEHVTQLSDLEKQLQDAQTKNECKFGQLGTLSIVFNI
jgi:kinesin family protein 15